MFKVNKGNNKITELRTIIQRESQNSQVYKLTKSVNNRKTVKTVKDHFATLELFLKTVSAIQ